MRMKGVTTLLIAVIFFLVVMVIMIIFIAKYTSVVDQGINLLKSVFEPFTPVFS